jgi:hypothetical protein
MCCVSEASLCTISLSSCLDEGTHISSSVLPCQAQHSNLGLAWQHSNLQNHKQNAGMQKFGECKVASRPTTHITMAQLHQHQLLHLLTNPYINSSTPSAHNKL